MIETKSRNWLKEVREKSNLTQDEAAAKAHIKRTTWASVEQGKRDPSVKTAKKMANAFNFEWTYFFTD